jgi:predicted TIM-barrel enzyme
VKTFGIAIIALVVGFTIGNAVGSYQTVTACKRSMHELTEHCIENIRSLSEKGKQ